MKTSEFIKKVEELGYDAIVVKNRRIEVMKNGEIYLWVSTVYDCLADMMNAYYRLNEEEIRYLFDIIIDYIKTPVAEREEEKEYHIRPNLPDNFNWNTIVCGDVLNYVEEEEQWVMGSKNNTRSYKTIFTESELLELGYKLTDFEYCKVGTNEWVKE